MDPSLKFQHRFYSTNTIRDSNNDVYPVVHLMSEKEEVEILTESLPTVSSTLGRECPICLDYLTKVGLHRIIVTKCGHIFGKNCLIRSLEMKRECPTCRKVIRKRDMIELYDCDVIAVDNSHSNELIKLQLDEERNLKKKIELENIKLNCCLGQMNYELVTMKANEIKLQEEINYLKKITGAMTKQIQQSSSSSSLVSDSFSFVFLFFDIFIGSFWFSCYDVIIFFIATSILTTFSIH